MAKYIIVRPFPAKDRLVRGQVIEDPQWRNLAKLVRTGYVRELRNEEPPAVAVSTWAVDPPSLPVTVEVSEGSVKASIKKAEKKPTAKKK